MSTRFTSTPAPELLQVAECRTLERAFPQGTVAVRCRHPGGAAVASFDSKRARFKTRPTSNAISHRTRNLSIWACDPQWKVGSKVALGQGCARGLERFNA